MLTLIPIAVALAACADTTNPVEDNEEEVITTVELTFTPTSGDPLVFLWADPENDGAPEIDEIVLTAGASYDLAVRFLNELEDPAEDISVEVEEEDDEHQVFLTGSAVSGPAADSAGAVLTVDYADTDGNGDPLGLEHSVDVSMAAANGLELVVTLRHLPPENDTPVKTSDLAADVLAGGLTALPGETDVSAAFPVRITAQ